MKLTNTAEFPLYNSSLLNSVELFFYRLMGIAMKTE